MNLRIKFDKTNEAKYISHLDLLRTFNRMIMRSMLTPSYSQGFNPHILLAFLQPSSVGMETKGDCADLTVEGTYDLNEVLKNLKENAPEGIVITSVCEAGEPKFNTLAYAEYTVKLTVDATKDEIIEFLRKDEILIDKKTKKGIKEVDIKPLMVSYEVMDGIILKLTLKAGSTENLNPQLLIKAMEKYMSVNVTETYIIREKLLTENMKAF